MHSFAVRTTLAAASLGLFTLPSLAQGNRPVLAPGATTNAGAKVGTDALVTTDMTWLTPQQLVQSLLGPGVTATNVLLNGAPLAAGTFQGGLGIVGIDSGIVLSSGDIASVAGPNASDFTSTATTAAGDADLDNLTTSPTFDACTLEFDFVCAAGGQISFQYVFASEEYNEFVNTQFNDVFGFFLNGTNIATLPGGMSVAINNVHCGNPYSASAGGNCALYVNNSCADLPVGTFPCTGPFDTEMDGLTVVLTATGTLQPGLNHIKLAIADAGDQVYDSNVFIRGQSFSCGAGGPFFAPPSPCGQTFQALVGVPVQFALDASAATGLPSNAVTLSAGPMPAGVAFTPALPVAASGQNPNALTTLAWTPTAAQLGNHALVFTATDQLGHATTCTITVNVAQPGTGNASATTIGTGCAPSGQYAELRCDVPVMGTTVDLEIRHALPNWLATHVFSPGAPVTTPLWGGCNAYVDLLTFTPFANVITDALGRNNLPIPIPSSPAYVGLELTFQSVFLFTPDPIGIRVSDGLYLVIGN